MKNLDPRKQTRKYKNRQLAQIKYGYATILICALFLPSYAKLESTGINTYKVYMGDTYVGTVDSEEVAENYLVQARREFAKESDELALADGDLTFKGSEELYGAVTERKEMVSAMKSVLSNNTKETLERCYTLKIGQYTTILSSTEDVVTVLQAALDKYQDERLFAAQLELDENRELYVLSPTVYRAETEVNEEEFSLSHDVNAGVWKYLDDNFEVIKPEDKMSFADYEQGIMDMYFDSEIEVVECYLPKSEITDVEKAVVEITQDEATPTIYEVESGDTLSQIAEKVDIPMDTLIEMNDALENEYSILQIGQEITITVPKAILSVDRVEQVYYEEDYEAEIIYVDNDEWYTTQTKTLQEPSAGHHNVIASITYHDDDKENVEYLKEEVTYDAVAKIVERGTKIPPTYIKPISGGRLTSNFGYRKRPTKGASSYHKGIDWATPTGTAVCASSGGTVLKAGWNGGYGYAVFIQHPDGRMTRYGHLSKVLVKAGQSVSQGQKIALSGNTGVSTGPHLHFEILINGSQVNPLNYLN